MNTKTIQKQILELIQKGLKQINLTKILQPTIATAIIGLLLITNITSITNNQFLNQLLIPHVQAQDYSQGLSGQAYLDYTAKMAKELDDIDYGYDYLKTDKKILNTGRNSRYIKYLFPDINFEELEKLKQPQYPYSYIKQGKCNILEYKHTLYYIYFDSICDRSSGGGQLFGPGASSLYQPYSTQIAKNDGWGYENYNGVLPQSTVNSICSPGVELTNSYDQFERKQDPKGYAQKLKDFPLRANRKPPTQEEYNKDECVKEFYNLYPKFVADKNKCDTSDWLIFELGILANPHCSAVNINDVPMKLKYYYTSWGLYKIGTKPDIEKDKRLNLTTRVEALADTDPEKPKAVLEKQKIEREKQRIEQEKKDRAKEGTNPGTEEADRLFFQKEKEEKERLDGIRAPNSKIVDDVKITIDTYKNKVKRWLIRTGLINIYNYCQNLLEDIFYYYRFSLPLMLLLFLIYACLSKIVKR